MRPGEWWVRRLLHSMCLSCKKPAEYVIELHSLEQQHANTAAINETATLLEEHILSSMY